MNVQAHPSITDAHGNAITPGYMSGVGNRFETEALPGGRHLRRFSPVGAIEYRDGLQTHFDPTRRDSW